MLHIEPIFWLGMGAIAVVVGVMQIVCWNLTPKAPRHD